uniref:Lem-4 n=1 Tax=Pristionchus pacificus TaxID=54126 RepID=A0A2A6BFC3_PRIPA|eukprot:PDM64615.1 lem-4 [Pristionchus pacificus]
MSMDTGGNENIAPASPIFAVYYPDDIKNSPRVFYQSVKDATKFANSPESRSKGARFRRFGNASEATNFFECGDAPVMATQSDNTATASDPAVNFSSIDAKSMNPLKKLIETDNLDGFRELTDSNPRYLINTSGDTASIVQAGFRFNALHIAATKGSYRVAEHMLKRVTDTDYLVMLYGTNEKDVQFRKANIIDSYLNTPDKSTNGDTPLHLACKWGHVEVARIIASYGQTIKDIKNQYGQTPLDLVCSRYSGEKKEQIMREFRTILHSFYVAIYRCSDHSRPLQWIVSSEYPQSSLASSTSHSSFLSPIVSPFLLTAVAGPFPSEEQAIQFQKRWKVKGLDRRRKDFDRGVEKVGRAMALEEDVKWAESWPFHTEPIDVKSNDGLEIIEKYLKEKIINEEEEGEFEDAQEEWDDDHSPLDGSNWNEGDSLGSLYSKMEALSMGDHSVKRFVSSMDRLDGVTRLNLPSLTSPRYWNNSPNSTRSRITKGIVPRTNMLNRLTDDNYHEDPHANLQWNKKRPKFEDHDMPTTSLHGEHKGGRKRKEGEEKLDAASIKKRRMMRSEHFKQRFRKNFTQLLEEENSANKDRQEEHGAWVKAVAPPSTKPPKKLCSVCGFPSKYNCTRCGTRFCRLRCRDIHNDTRCMKWTA